jgi:hypothetical protein
MLGDEETRRTFQGRVHCWRECTAGAETAALAVFRRLLALYRNPKLGATNEARQSR